jgi:bifunctional DNase/RNase
LALAVRVGAPIYAEESVLDKAGIVLDEEAGKPGAEGKVDEQELKGLSAYKEFINTLDLEDFKKHQS